MSWWNKKQNTEAINRIAPTLGDKLKKAYDKKLRQKKNGKSK